MLNSVFQALNTADTTLRGVVLHVLDLWLEELLGAPSHANGGLRGKQVHTSTIICKQSFHESMKTSCFLFIIKIALVQIPSDAYRACLMPIYVLVCQFKDVIIAQRAIERVVTAMLNKVLDGTRIILFAPTVAALRLMQTGFRFAGDGQQFAVDLHQESLYAAQLMFDLGAEAYVFSFRPQFLEGSFCCHLGFRNRVFVSYPGLHHPRRANSFTKLVAPLKNHWRILTQHNLRPTSWTTHPSPRWKPRRRLLRPNQNHQPPSSAANENLRHRLKRLFRMSGLTRRVQLWNLAGAKKPRLLPPSLKLELSRRLPQQAKKIPKPSPRLWLGTKLSLLTPLPVKRMMTGNTYLWCRH